MKRVIFLLICLFVLSSLQNNALRGETSATSAISVILPGFIETELEMDLPLPWIIVCESDGYVGDGDYDGKKITICHKPGTPAEQTIRVSIVALPPHLAHGDHIGPCGGGCVCEELIIKITARIQYSYDNLQIYHNMLPPITESGAVVAEVTGTTINHTNPSSTVIHHNNELNESNFGTEVLQTSIVGYGELLVEWDLVINASEVPDTCSNIKIDNYTINIQAL